MSTGADNKTMPVTREYEDGHERIFGQRAQRAQGRYVHRPGHPRANERGMVSVNDLGDEQLTDVRRVDVLSDLYMDGVHALDGADIGSWTKRREYMRARDLVDADDYKQTWARAEQERAAIKDGTAPNRDARGRTEDVRDAIERIRAGRGTKALTMKDWDNP